MTSRQIHAGPQFKILCISAFLMPMQLFFSTEACGFSFTWGNKNISWRPIVSIGAGASITPQAAASQTFPIQDPVKDEFYHYSDSQMAQSGLLTGFLGAEFSLFPKWDLQIGAEYKQAAPFSAQGTLTQGADIQSEDAYHYYYQIFARQLLLEGKLLYTTHEKYHPYLLAGVGASFNRAFNYYTNVPPFITFTRMYQNNSMSSFSYALGAGFDVDITPHLRVGAGYRFADLGKVKLGSAVIDVTPVNGTLAQNHLYTNEVIAQITMMV